jgi:hypothetical protein
MENNKIINEALCIVEKLINDRKIDGESASTLIRALCIGQQTTPTIITLPNTNLPDKIIEVGNPILNPFKYGVTGTTNDFVEDKSICYVVK